MVLKIPWKNLYGASVEASIERLFLLVTPNREVKYDPEKEDKILLQNKQNELQRVEEAKKREAQKGTLLFYFILCVVKIFININHNHYYVQINRKWTIRLWKNWLLKS